MAKKKSAKPQENPVKSLAAHKRKRKAVKARRNPATLEVNPPLLADFKSSILPAFGAYGATRVLQRLVWTLVSKKWPKLCKHAHAATGAAAFAGVWFGAHRVQRLAAYHDGIVAGTAVAALQGIASAYLPTKYSWLLSDCDANQLATAKPAAPTAELPAPAAETPAAGDEYSYLEDALAELNRGGQALSPKATSRAVSQTLSLAGKGPGFDTDLMDELEPGEEIDDLYAGAFAPN